MWLPHFDVLSQKQANSYRKSLMFKTCQTGGLTKVRACDSAQQKKSGGKKTWKARQGLGIFSYIWVAGMLGVEELQLRNHNSSGGVLQDTCRRGAIPHAWYSWEGEHVSRVISLKPPQMTLPRRTEASSPFVCISVAQCLGFVVSLLTLSSTDTCGAKWQGLFIMIRFLKCYIQCPQFCVCVTHCFNAITSECAASQAQTSQWVYSRGAN